MNMKHLLFKSLFHFDLTFSYFYYEKLEHGDLNWIIPGKFVAMSSPLSVQPEGAKIKLFTPGKISQLNWPIPEDYLPIFKNWGITTVIRLSKKEYQKNKFVQAGIRHYDLFFEDGTPPSDAILKRFLDIVESEEGVIAVHCKAGLGRTGSY